MEETTTRVFVFRDQEGSEECCFGKMFVEAGELAGLAGTLEIVKGRKTALFALDSLAKSKDSIIRPYHVSRRGT